MVKSDNKIELAVLKKELFMVKETNDRDHKEMKRTLGDIITKLDTVIEEKVDKSEFIFWRNLLVSGLILGIFMMLIVLFFRQ